MKNLSSAAVVISALNELAQEILVIIAYFHKSLLLTPMLPGRIGQSVTCPKILITNGSRMTAKRIAECPWSILQYF